MTMEVDAFLADAAETVNGKIYAMGIGWNTIHARSFPVRHSRIAIGITIHVPYTATNQAHKITIHLEDSDGQRQSLGDVPMEPSDQGPRAIQELGGEFNVGRPPLLPAGDEQVVAIALSVDQMRFEKPDRFVWVVSIDGTPVKRLPMRVQQLVQPGPVG